MKLSSDTPVGELGFVRKSQAAALRKLSLYTLGDLLWHVPRRHEDRRAFERFPKVATDRPACLLCEVEKRTFQRWGRRTVVEAIVRDVSHGAEPAGRLVCRWFHAWHAAKSVVEGASMVVFGTVKQKGRRLIVEHPEFEMIEGKAPDSLLHTGRIVPVHAAGSGVSVRVLRRLLRDALDAVDWALVPEVLPVELRTMPTADMLRALHFPDSFEELVRARRQAALAELYALQCELARRRAQTEAIPKPPRPIDKPLLDGFLDGLPFGLTEAQRRVLGEICADIAAARPMNRLLQGDVGSGKTVVAAAAMVVELAAGYECALMAPTRLLARQHHRTLSAWLGPLGIPVLLHTGEAPATREPLMEGKGVGLPPVVVGTHALIHGGFPFQRLGLAVIDEQHKFGVAQRERLCAMGTATDTLIMTATPIPRTLSLTLYGDLPVSVIDALPCGRGEVITRVRRPEALPRIADFLRGELAAGRQAFLVHPLIDESEAAAEVRAATAEFRKWSERLAPARVALLHGRLPPEERDRIMEEFAAGRIAVLVATTVVEVGIDVPNATIMLIANAERFGLAQLHQLRGRIGRGTGAARSYCILLMGEQAGDEEEECLRILEETRDGFRIAEEDFRRRGPGNLIGLEQSGLPPLRIADLRADHDLMLVAREAAAHVPQKVM